MTSSLAPQKTPSPDGVSDLGALRDFEDPAAWSQQARESGARFSVAVRSGDAVRARAWAKTASPERLAAAVLGWADVCAQECDTSFALPRADAAGPQHLAAHASAIAQALLDEAPADPANFLGQAGARLAMKMAGKQGLAALYRNGPARVLLHGALLSTLVERSDPLPPAAFDLLLKHPHPQPLASARQAGMAPPHPSEAAARALLSAERLAAGEAWRCVELSRLARWSDCSELVDPQRSVGAKARSTFSKALILACAAGCDRRAANLLCFMARPAPATLSAACLASIGAMPGDQKAALDAAESFKSPQSPYVSSQDGGSASNAHAFGRPLGALFQREEWTGSVEQIECAKFCATFALMRGMRSAIETCAVYGGGFKHSDREIAARMLGEPEVARLESCCVRRAAIKPAPQDNAPGRPRL